MLKAWLLLAAVNDPKKLQLEGTTSKIAGLTWQDILLLSGGLVLLAVLLFIWVYVARKNSRPHYTEAGARIIYRAEKKDAEREGRRRRRKRRPNHPDNLPRNPTLAEAGGLPPVRSDEPTEPAQ